MSEDTLQRSSRTKDLTGREFHGLTALAFAGYKSRCALWLCRCECGNEWTASANHLQSGHTKSCGCRKARVTRLRSFVHGGAVRRVDGRGQTRVYGIWRNMLTRCYNKNIPEYARYGGRGVTVCERWQAPHGFVNFLEDMDYPPSSKHTLDRIETNGHYTPENCRWATMTQQNRNRRNNRLITHGGRTQCLAAWAEETGLSSLLIGHRLKRGWSVERALTTPLVNGG
jgi:hypothetical protein